MHTTRNDILPHDFKTSERIHTKFEQGEWMDGDSSMEDAGGGERRRGGGEDHRGGGELEGEQERVTKSL